MASALSVINIGIAPEIHLGPLTLAWHGVTIAVGIVIGGLVASQFARERGLDPQPLTAIGLVLVVSALAGARLFYLGEHGGLADPSQWFGTRGFTFNGGFIAAAIAIAVYLRVKRLDVRYLDAVAVGLPLGVAIGRIGDVINGEHYGEPTGFFLGVRNTNPDALVPDNTVAYHSGGLYEVLLAALIFALVWWLQGRVRRPLELTWAVLGLFALGRFFEFFTRADSEQVALGLNTAQWTSIALLAATVIGVALTRGRHLPREPRFGSARR